MSVVFRGISLQTVAGRCGLGSWILRASKSRDMRAAGISSIPKVGIRIRLHHALNRDLRSSGHTFAPIPECSSALTATTSAATAAFTMVYSDVIGCESVSVTTVAGNLDAGNLAAAVSARERNDERAICRNRAPATICNVLHPYAPGCNVRQPLGRLLSSRRSRQLLVACQAAVSVSRGSIARTAFRVSADRSAFRRS